MSQWPSTLRYNLVSDAIASFHYLHILVVYLLYSGTLRHTVLHCHQFLDMLLLCSESYHPQYVVFVKRLYFDNTSKEEVHWGDGSGNCGVHATGPWQSIHLLGTPNYKPTLPTLYMCNTHTCTYMISI